MNSKGGFFIGELAKQAGVTVDTIRYYEKIGLLPRPQRRMSGYRVYDPQTVYQLVFIKQSQELGLSLAEIAQLLQLQKNDRAACIEVKQLLINKIAETDRRIQALQDFRQTLQTRLAECNAVLAQGQDSGCPVLEDVPFVAIKARKKLDPGAKTRV